MLCRAGPEALALVGWVVVDVLPGIVGDVGHRVRQPGQLLGDARAVAEKELVIRLSKPVAVEAPELVRCESEKLATASELL